MHRILISVIAAASAMALTQIASAADLPRKAPPAPLPPPPFSWTGFYVGLNAGGSWGRDEGNYSVTPAAVTIPLFSRTLDPNGFIGGGQIGYNWQTGSIVLGIEADIAYRHVTDSAVFTSGIDQVTLTGEQNWVGTVRPRIGYAVQNWLLYVTGGLAYGSFTHSYFENRTTVPGQNRLQSGDTTKTGWTVGGGTEWAFNPHWSVAIEYLYMKFDDTTLSQPAQTVGGLAFAVSSATFTDSSQVVRGKVNYRF